MATEGPARRTRRDVAEGGARGRRGRRGPEADPQEAATPEPVRADPQKRVRPVDFRRPTKFSREGIRRLEHAYDGFARLASTRMGAELRTPFELAHTATDQLPYGTVLAGMDQDRTYVAILEVQPLDTAIALSYELPLAVSLVDGMLGGGAMPRAEQPESLTELELVVLKRAVRSLVESLSATWHELAGVEVTVRTAATSPLNLSIAPPSEPTLVLLSEAKAGGQTSPVSLILPHAAIASIVAKLDRSGAAQSAVDPDELARVRAAMSGVDVELRAEVGAVSLPLGDVLRFAPGDLLRLRRPAGAGVVVLAGDVPTYRATPGRNGPSRAVQIDGPVEDGR